VGPPVANHCSSNGASESADYQARLDCAGRGLSERGTCREADAGAADYTPFDGFGHFAHW
jgi:hypothetical protein